MSRNRSTFYLQGGTALCPFRPSTFVGGTGGVFLKMREETQRVHRFIEDFESLYGRKPLPGDADSDFRIRVAIEMEMSVGLACHYLRLAAEVEQENTSAKAFPS